MRFVLLIIGIMLALDVALLAAFVFLARGSRWKWMSVIFMTVQIIGLLWIILGRFRGWGAQVPKFWLSIVYLWHFLGLAVFVPITAVIVFIILDREIRRRAAMGKRPQEPSDLVVNRRQFLGAALAVAPPLFSIGLTAIAYRQLHHFRVRRFTLPIAGLPRDLVGLTIAQVSDIHVGRFTSDRVLREMVRVTNDFRPDLVFVTGDIINNALVDLSEAIGIVRSLQGRFGVWVIEGNHDLIENAEEFRRRMKASDLKFLLGESAVVEVYGQPVQILGVPWLTRRRVERDQAIGDSVRNVLRHRWPGGFPILLGHHPHVFDTAAEAGVPLTLAGHTHGGQLMLNEQMGAGPALFRYWSGHYQRAKSHLIVSNGVGNWFPIRINAPAEIVHITLAEG